MRIDRCSMRPIEARPVANGKQAKKKSPTAGAERGGSLDTVPNRSTAGRAQAAPQVLRYGLARCVYLSRTCHAACALD